LAVEGSYVAVGAQLSTGTTGVVSKGDVMIFNKGTGDKWTQTQTITGSQVAAADSL
jgi:hypothetical protein